MPQTATPDAATDARSTLTRDFPDFITPASHLDHAMTAEILRAICEKFAGRTAFFIESFELSEELGTVPCGIHGPIMGDAPVTEAEVTYERRGDRAHESRLCFRAPRATRTVTVIAGPHEGKACILYTAFGGPLSPKEPGDATLSADNRDFAEKFWAEHALSA